MAQFLQAESTALCSELKETCEQLGGRVPDAWLRLGHQPPCLRPNHRGQVSSRRPHDSPPSLQTRVLKGQASECLRRPSVQTAGDVRNAEEADGPHPPAHE